MIGTSYPFRVFISYAHADKDLIVSMVRILEDLGLHPLWDQDINPGRPFTDEIKELITRSHLFIPVITPNSEDRPWVHQETGFAIALNIPILPITIGHIPGEMIAPIQAIPVQPDLSDLAERLREIDLMRLVAPRPQKPYGVMEIAESPEARAEMIARYADWVTSLGEYGLVRIQARFGGIFSIPDRDPDDSLWDQRDGGTAQRSKYLRDLQRKERHVIEQYARLGSLRLIIDPEGATFTEQGTAARKTRLLILRDSLNNLPADKVEVVMSTRAGETNLIIVGDHFMAESQAARASGYRQTIIDSHPPTVLQQLRRYDQTFDELKASQDVTLAAAVQKIEAALAGL